MGYRQTWFTSNKRELPEDVLKSKWEVSACFGPMPFATQNQHWTTQVIHPELRGKFITLLTWMKEYFVFSFDLLEKETGQQKYKKQGEENKFRDYPDHNIFLIGFKDSAFISNKHRLLFLTLLRIAQETPNILGIWEPETKFEGLCQASADWYFHGDGANLSGPYTDRNTGHMLINYNTDKIKHWPSLETVLVYLHQSPETSIHFLSASILKGNTKDV